MNYDVFISYRRKDAAEYARQIQLKLENYGYTVFLDHDELKDGRFDQRIIDAIEGSKVFIALLTPLYMSRCADAEDWVRKEIECAVKNNLHIVPINIDRQFCDFPADCPASLRTHIGQHQYSEVFTGQHFTTTMNDLNENRLKPYLGGGSARPSALGAIVRIRPDMDCRMMKFGEEVALLQGGAYNIVRLMKGKHPLDFVSLECPTDHIEKVYVVEDNQSEDFFEVELAPIKAKRLKSIEDEKRRQREEAERIKRQEEEAKRREAERIEAERRAKAEAERKAKEEAERKANLAKERTRLIESEKARIAQMVLDGKGRDGMYMVGDYYNRDGVRGVVISPKSVCPDRDYTYRCGGDMLISLTEEGNAQWASDKNFGTLFKKDIPCKNDVGMHFIYEDYNPQNKISKIENWRAKYPAFDKAAHGNWHLPSCKCLENYVFPRLTPINNTLRRLSAQEIKQNRKYWSCEECGSDSAYAVDSKESHYYPKSDVMAVRSVHPFNVSMSATDIENEKIWRNLGLVPCQEGLTDDPTIVKEYNEYWKFLTDSKKDDQKPSNHEPFDEEAVKDWINSLINTKVEI